MEPLAARMDFEFDPLPEGFAATVEALVNAIEAAGSLDAGKVRDALAKTNFDSLYGHIAFNDKGQISLPQIMIQIQNDQVVEIYSGGKFVNKPVYPLPTWDKR
jgi:branched-chain amino acid transport system substrate-binding protein